MMVVGAAETLSVAAPMQTTRHAPDVDRARAVSQNLNQTVGVVLQH